MYVTCKINIYQTRVCTRSFRNVNMLQHDHLHMLQHHYARSITHTQRITNLGRPCSSPRSQSRTHFLCPHHHHNHKRFVATKATKKSFKSFDDMIANSSKPVLVDFYATWCGPCQMMSQVLNVSGLHVVRDHVVDYRHRHRRRHPSNTHSTPHATTGGIITGSREQCADCQNRHRKVQRDCEPVQRAGSSHVGVVQAWSASG